MENKKIKKYPENKTYKKEKINVLAYVRVSTTDQTKAGSHRNQIMRINKYLEKNLDEINLIKWYIDEGKSALKERPEYHSMVEDLFEGKADAILFTRLDRIGRSVSHLSNLLGQINENKKDLIAIEQNLNTKTITGKLLYHILSAIAQFEIELFKERSREGLERAKLEGKHIGRPKIKLSEEDIKYMKKLYENSKLGCHVIAKIMKSKNIKISPGSVRNKLKNNGVEMRNIYGR